MIYVRCFSIGSKTNRSSYPPTPRVPPSCNPSNLIRRIEIHQRLHQSRTHRLLAFPHPYPRVIIALVRLILAIRVTHLLHQIVLLLEHIVSDAREVGVLQVGVEVDFDDAVADGFLVFLLGGAGAAVEDEEDGFFFRGGGLVFDVFLVWEVGGISWIRGFGGGGLRFPRSSGWRRTFPGL